MIREHAPIQRASSTPTSWIPEPLKKAYTNCPLSIRIAALTAAFCGSLAGVRYCQNRGAWNDIVFVPIVEETIFRLGVHSVLKVLQKLMTKGTLTPAQEVAQAVQRVLVSSFLFGFSHQGTALWLGWTLGRSTGYLYESTHSVALPIIVHAAHNTIDALCRPDPYLYAISQLLLHGTVLWKLGKRINPIMACYDHFWNKSVAEIPVAPAQPRTDSRGRRRH